MHDWEKEREKYAGTVCVLDGKQARIAGAKLRHAYVMQFPAEGTAVEFSWLTVAHVMEHAAGWFSS